MRCEAQETFYQLADIQTAIHRLDCRREVMEAKIRKQQQIQDQGPRSTASFLDLDAEELNANQWT